MTGVADPLAVQPPPLPLRRSGLGLGMLLALWLWPVLLVGLGVMYLQHRSSERLSALLVDYPKVLVVDEIKMMERAIARGADPNSFTEVESGVRAELAALAGNDTIILPRQVVTAVPTRFQVTSEVPNEIP